MGATEDKLEGPDLTQGFEVTKLVEGKPLVGLVEDDEVVVIKQGDEIHAIGRRCTHYGAPLDDGAVVDGTIRCPWHHAVFDLETGVAEGAPAFGSAGCYPVEIEGDVVRVLPKREERTPEEREGPESVVFVGAGAAAAAAAETFRQRGYRGAITMIGAEPSGPVDRPNLSKDYLAGQAEESWIPLGGDEHWEEMGVELITGDEVVSIDREHRRLSTESGQTYDYDVLFYTTGVEPVVPPIEGLEEVEAYTLRSFGDAQRISQAADQGQRALVVGAGFIGLEVAASLNDRGLEVSVVAPEELPLASVMGEEIGKLVHRLHEEAGETFYLGTTVERLEDGRATLADGREVEFDFVVLGTGVKPRTRLAEEAGLDVDDGVLVDEQLRTSDEHIFAVGDVARYPDSGGEGTARVEHWVLAQRLAQRAARVVLDEEPPNYTKVPFFWSRHHGVSISYVGYASEVDEVVVCGSVEDQDGAVGFVRDGQVLAVATVGRAVDSLHAEDALARGDQEALWEILGARR